MNFDYWLSNSFPNGDSKVIPPNPSFSSGRRKHDKLGKRKNAASKAKRLEEKEKETWVRMIYYRIAVLIK